MCSRIDFSSFNLLLFFFGRWFFRVLCHNSYLSFGPMTEALYFLRFIALGKNYPQREEPSSDGVIATNELLLFA